MALRALLSAEEWGSLPEALKAEYVAGEGGRYRLDVTEVEGLRLEDVGGLKSALEKERAAARKNAEQLKAWEGLDSTKAKAALERLAELEASDPGKKAEELAKARIEQIARKHAQDLEAAGAKEKALIGQLERHLVDSAATQALQAAGGNIPLLMPHIRGQIKMRQSEGGEFLASVIDPVSGVERVGDARGTPMTIAQLVTEMKGHDAYKVAFAGSGATGSGSTPAARSPSVSRGKIVIDGNDPDAISRNMEAIAKGEAIIETKSKR